MADVAAVFQDVLQKILTIHERHVTSVLEVEEAIVNFINITEASNDVPDDGPPDDLSCLIEILRHQPFTPNYASTSSPYIAYLSDLLTGLPEHELTRFLLRVLRILKVLLRKPVNRQRISEGDITAVVRHLLIRNSSAVAIECANVIQNLCFERANVNKLLRCNGIAPLVTLLRSTDTEVQASACGVIQSICYLARGRQAARDCDAVSALAVLLPSPSPRVQLRAAASLQNLSCDPQSVRLIRRSNGVAPLVALLRSSDVVCAGAAAGTLQNMSREAASRQLIRQLGGIKPLAVLLAAPYLPAQVAATGALLNLLGPVLERASEATAQKKALGRLLSCALALSMFEQSLSKASESLVSDRAHKR